MLVLETMKEQMSKLENRSPSLFLVYLHSDLFSNSPSNQLTSKDALWLGDCLEEDNFKG